MDAGKVKAPPVTIPVDDGTFDRTLEAFDGKFSQWLAAVDTAQSALLELWTRPSPAESESAVDVQANAGAVAVAESDEAAGASVVDEHDDVGVEAAEAGAAATTDAEAPEESEIRPPRFTGKEIEEPPAAESEDPELARRREEEAMLAGLDPQVAQQVKMIRRMSDGRRKLSDVIAEVQASLAGGDDAKPRKKQWWR